MRDRPILFKPDMVRAILDGRKTQTRRIVRCGPHDVIHHIDGRPWRSNIYGMAAIPCPYGVPGDRLWVRETWGYRGTAWCSSTPDVHDVQIAYAADGARLEFRRAAKDYSGLPKQICKCSGKGDTIDQRMEHSEELSRFWRSWRPSIFLPRWASRITLEITDVRVQKLRDISEEDARAEGVKPFPKDPEGDCWTDGTHRTAFEHAWNEMYGWNPNAWGLSSWVWALTFRRIDAAESGMAAALEQQEAAS